MSNLAEVDQVNILDEAILALERARSLAIRNEEFAAQDAAEAEVKRIADEASEQLRKEREEALRPDNKKLRSWLQSVINFAHSEKPSMGTQEGSDALEILIAAIEKLDKF